MFIVGVDRILILQINNLFVIPENVALSKNRPVRSQVLKSWCSGDEWFSQDKGYDSGEIISAVNFS